MAGLKNIMIGDLLIFIKVIECKSFSIAARELSKSVSAVSKAISKIENGLNSKLLTRNAHKLEVTSDGNLVYEKAKLLCFHYNEIASELSVNTDAIQGTLRLSAPSILCDEILPAWIGNYMNIHPDVKINLASREGGSFSGNSPEFDDLVIKSGYLDSPDLIHKKINPVPFGIYASPAYLDEMDSINKPQDILNLNLLRLQHPSLSGKISLTHHKELTTISLPNSALFTSNSVRSIINMTLEGKGVGLAIPDWVVASYIDAGLLQRVLPDWELPPLPSYMVWRYRKHYSRLFRDFISFIETQWNGQFAL